MPTHVRGSIPSMSYGCPGAASLSHLGSERHPSATRSSSCGQPASQQSHLRRFWWPLACPGFPWFSVFTSNWKPLWRWGCWTERSGPFPVMTGLSVWVPFPSQRKLNTNGLYAVTHTFPAHTVICTCIHIQNMPSTILPRTKSVHMYWTAASKSDSHVSNKHKVYTVCGMN